MKMKKVVALGAAVGVALAGLGLALPANAEPVSNGYVLVGSDTLQDSTNALLNGTSVGGAPVRVTSAGSTLGSFDAFGSTAIQTKSGGQYFGRPAGSGAGVTALRASITGNAYSGNPAVPARVITGQVDIARSSSGPGGNANTSGLLAYVPYGRDAVAYAYNGTNSDLANLTTAQLKQIYEASTPVTIGTTVVKPRIPQNGSGTRSFFLSAIGVTTLGSTVPDSNNTTPENDASILGADEIIPFSAASWVAQANNVAGVNTIAASTGVAMGSPVSGAAPFTGTAPSLVPNSAFYSNTTFGRDTYLIVERARVQSSFTYTGAPSYDPVLANLVNSASITSLTSFSLSPLAAGSVKRKFGFLAPSSTTPVAAYAQG